MRVPVFLLVLVVLAQAGGLLLSARPELRPALWGFHAWTFAGDRLLVLLLPLPVLAFLWTPGGRRLLRGGAGIALLGVLAGLAVVAADRTHLLGDGRFWIAAARGPAVYHAHEPLAFALAWVTGHPAGDPARTARALEILNLAIGLGGLLLIASISRRAGKTGAERLLVASSLVVSGLAPLACGYVEAYPLLALATLFVVHRGLVPATRDRDALLLGLAAGLAAGVHLLGFLLLPAVAYRLLRRYRAMRPRIVAAAAAALPVLFAYVVLPRLMHTAGGDTAGPGDAATGALGLAGSFRLPARGMGSWLLDQASRWMLLAPLSLALLLPALMLRISGRVDRRSGPARGDREPDATVETSRESSPIPFLLLASLPVLPAFLLDTEGSRGAAFDWDSFAAVVAPPAVLLALLAAPLLKRRAGTIAVAAASMVAALSVGGFILANSREGPAVARARMLARATVPTAKARALAFESLALYHRDRGDSLIAGIDYLDAARATPGNPRLWRNAAALFSRFGRSDLAVEAYRGLVGAGAADAGTWFRYGLALEAEGETAEARTAWREALARDPDDVGTLNKLAESLLRGKPAAGEETEAYRLLRRSLSIRPDQPFAEAMRRAVDALEARGVGESPR